MALFTCRNTSISERKEWKRENNKRIKAKYLASSSFLALFIISADPPVSVDCVNTFFFYRNARIS